VAGIVTARELAASGLSGSQVRLLRRQGRLVVLARGVYAPAQVFASESRTPSGQHAVRVAVALVRCGEEAAGSHHAAALLHRLDLLDRTGAEVVQVTRPPGAGSRTGVTGVRIHPAALPPHHTVVTRGVRVTSIARTVVDLARTSSLRAGVVVADSALRDGRVSKSDLTAVLADCEHWPGIRTARQAVRFGDGRAESVLESLARLAFHEHGLPAPELQVWVGDGESRIGRTDFLWRQERTIAEADGALKYADPSRARAQLQRDARLRAAGFEVVHFTYHDLVHAPERVVSSITTAFRRTAVLSGVQHPSSGH
jgi:hypothetical protein